MRSPPPTLLAMIAAAWLFTFGLADRAEAQTLQIDTLKANYIDGFIDFIRWSGNQRPDEVRIGVIGSRELARHLQRVASEKEQGRQLQIVQVTPTERFDELQVLFVGTGNRQHWSDLRSKCREGKVLLIGEEEGFVSSGGCIEFVVRKNRLRFIISGENASACGLTVSSKLVELAIN